LYWLQRHAKWAWPIALVAGVLLVVGLRVWPGGSPRRASSDAGAANGVAVPASAARYLWFRFDLPTIASGAHAGDQHEIVVEVSCQQP